MKLRVHEPGWLLSCGMGREQANDRRVRGRRRVLRKRYAFAIGGAGQGRVTGQQPLNPGKVALAEREEHILDLDRQQTALLAQMMNRPPGRRGVVCRVTRVDVRAHGDEEIDDLGMRQEGRVVERRGAITIASVHERRIGRQQFSYCRRITASYCEEERL